MTKFFKSSSNIEINFLCKDSVGSPKIIFKSTILSFFFSSVFTAVALPYNSAGIGILKYKAKNTIFKTIVTT